MAQALFNIGRSSLLAYQSMITVTSQNISNLQNSSYTRMIPTIASNTLGSTSNITQDLAMGVKLDEVKRARNELLNDYYRSQNNQLSSLTTSQTIYEEIEFTFDETGDFAFSDTLDSFWEAWQSLQDSPEDLSVRANVVQVGGLVADTIRSKNEQLTTLQKNITDNLDYDIAQVNNLIEQLNDVNKNLTKSWIETSVERNELLDRKDTIIDQLTAEMNFQVTEESTGAVNLYLNGTPMFNGTEFRQFEMDSAGNLWITKDGVQEETVTLKGGTIYGYMNMRDTVIPQYKAQLNSFATNLIDNVNRIHQNGYDLNGDAGIEFFTGTDAGDIKVNSVLGDATVGDPTKVATALATIHSSDHINYNSTATMTFKGNLNNEDVGFSYVTNVTSKDTGGDSTIVTFTFTKTADGPPSTWDWTAKSSGTTFSTNTGTVAYDSDGAYDAANSTANPFITYTPSNGTPDVTVNLDFTTTRQADATTSTITGKAAAGTIDGSKTIAAQSERFQFATPDANGTFVINGVSFNWTSGDTIQDIVNQINNYTPPAGSTGPGVTASWDPDLQKLVLLRDPTVDPPSGAGPTITVSDTTGNFTTFMGLDTAVMNKNNEGSGENAIALSKLWSTKVVTVGTSTTPTFTLDEQYLAISNLVAKNKNLNDNLQSNKKSLVDNIGVQRSEDSTVSLDEEMVNVMKYQQAYGATSRLITMADEMLDRLINRTGVVGT